MVTRALACPDMHPREFAQKWQTYALEVTEEQGYVDHYRDVASLVNGPVPGEKGAPPGLTYQAGVKKVGSTDFGKADVFLPGHFIWEAKRAQKTADARAKAKARGGQEPVHRRFLASPGPHRDARTAGRAVQECGDRAVAGDHPRSPARVAGIPCRRAGWGRGLLHLLKRKAQG